MGKGMKEEILEEQKRSRRKKREDKDFQNRSREDVIKTERKCSSDNRN